MRLSDPLPSRVGSARLCAVAKRSLVAVILLVVLVVGIAVTAVVFRTRLLPAGFPGPGVTAAELPAGRPAPGNLRIAGWNIRNFPFDERPEDPDLGFSRRTNICDLEVVLGGLQADLVGVEEIRDRRHFQSILRRAGGPGVGWRPRGGLEVGRPRSRA